MHRKRYHFAVVHNPNRLKLLLWYWYNYIITPIKIYTIFSQRTNRQINKNIVFLAGTPC